jgi:putative flavoprotein involved in K+ transport
VKTRALNAPQNRVTAVIIGGGQAGLATSHQLSCLGIDHVVLERGEVANSWRRERWDSLRLLTPNWQTQMPDFAYSGNDPDGFMTMDEVTSFFTDYARFCHAPIHVDTKVTAVDAIAQGYRVQTNRGSWHCRAVVLASGPYNIPVVPALSAALPNNIEQLTTHQYRNPEQLNSGGVLVVGASATGLQLAQEIQQSGRQVTLAIGEHLRMPRRYRGRDIQSWLHTIGLLDECISQVDDIRRVRNLPSPQLIGHPDHLTLDLNSLGKQGVECVGRLVGMQDSTAQFSGALANATKMSDLKQQRLLNSIDEWIYKSTGATVTDTDRP